MVLKDQVLAACSSLQVADELVGLGETLPIKRVAWRHLDDLLQCLRVDRFGLGPPGRLWSPAVIVSRPPGLL
jgi:hypothetical protein